MDWSWIAAAILALLAAAFVRRAKGPWGGVMK